MKLAKKFKFYHVSYRPFVYTADVVDDQVVVSWDWGDDASDTGSTTYGAVSAEEYIIDGIWIITEVMEASNAAE